MHVWRKIWSSLCTEMLFMQDKLPPLGRSAPGMFREGALSAVICGIAILCQICLLPQVNFYIHELWLDNSLGNVKWVTLICMKLAQPESPIYMLHTVAHVNISHSKQGQAYESGLSSTKKSNLLSRHFIVPWGLAVKLDSHCWEPLLQKFYFVMDPEIYK